MHPTVFSPCVQQSTGTAIFHKHLNHRRGIVSTAVLKIISLISATTLTGKSERTLWRWVTDGTLLRSNNEIGRGKTAVCLDSVKPHFCVPLAPEDFDLVLSADAGNAEAQNDLGLFFLENEKPKSAVYWLKLAAKQEYGDAMHWLGRCYLEGKGVAKEENMGIMWLSKAAAISHGISQAQMQVLRDGFIKNSCGLCLHE
ncbi:MAG: tetratricopeptide repeat protein [Pseudomonadota bacterium]